MFIHIYTRLRQKFLLNLVIDKDVIEVYLNVLFLFIQLKILLIIPLRFYLVNKFPLIILGIFIVLTGNGNLLPNITSTRQVIILIFFLLKGLVLLLTRRFIIKRMV